MSAKFVLLIFGTLWLAQCILANAAEKSRKDFYVKLHTFFIELTDDIIVSLQNNFEPVINDVQNNKITVKSPLKEKLKELKTILDNASIPGTDKNLINRRDKFFRKFSRIYLEIQEIQLDIGDPTAGDKAVSQAYENTKNYLKEKITKFAKDSIPEVEKYLATLPAMDHRFWAQYRDKLIAVKNEESIEMKVKLLTKQ